MFPMWRLRLREARLAWHGGRYDEASTLLSAESLREFLPAKELARDVAGKIVERAGDRFASGDSLAGWQDVLTAERLGGQGEAIGHLRRQVAAYGLDEARGYLSAGQPQAALARLDKLERRGLLDAVGRRCQEIARRMREAQQEAVHGHFSKAAAAIADAQRLADQAAAGDATMDTVAERLEELAGVLERKRDESVRLSAELHAALSREDWPAVLTAADALLALAPQHLAARQARRRAWQAVGMDVTRLHAGGKSPTPVSLKLDRAAGRRGRHSTHRAARTGEDDTVAGKEPPKRAVLWVDAVGGFLVCFDDEVVLGQPTPGAALAIPILADLSRRHAVIRRDAGAYVLEPVQETRVDGRPITGPVILADNQVIELGESVRVRFSKPHALSATARLTIESHHKTQPSADAILLMADSLVLGPHRHCHVTCRDWERDVVLYRQNERLHCRADVPLSVDGVASDGPVEVKSGARVEGEDFSFAWETV